MLTTLFILALAWHQGFGHGWMYYPPGWNQKTPCQEDKGPYYCIYGVTYQNIPEENCMTVSNGPPCSNRAFENQKPTDWFTNWTFVNGPPTIPMEMYDPYIESPREETPWNRPGSAPIYGEGCGANGGNPNGCGNGELFGSCCGDSCAAYSYGKSALEHAFEGSFDNAFTTKWQRGSSQPVIWSSNMGHRGGYAYRLCKVPLNAGILGVSEECFQAGHLEFDGNDQWIIQDPDDELSGGWTRIDAVRTKEGTFPEGSHWTRATIPVPPGTKKSQWAIKDHVKVPEGLEPGMYILSFRWDCLRTPQVWSICANIEIV